VSRWLVTTVFLFVTVGTATGVAEAAREAWAASNVTAVAVVGYSVLKLGIALAFSVFVFVREPSRRPSRDPLAFAACAAAMGSLVLLEKPETSDSAVLVLAGDLLAFASCAWLLVAVLALGRCFGVLPEARGLVTDGPYRFVRHPVYLGEFGAFAGLVLASPTVRNLVAGVVFVLAQAVRMRLEEDALTEEFPEYVDYAERTPRLVPLAPVRAILLSSLRVR
jgi:protein-S-isoprenylcysteine O-methyltransferase Ste14